MGKVIRSNGRHSIPSVSSREGFEEADTWGEDPEWMLEARKLDSTPSIIPQANSRPKPNKADKD